MPKKNQLDSFKKIVFSTESVFPSSFRPVHGFLPDKRGRDSLSLLNGNILSLLPSVQVRKQHTVNSRYFWRRIKNNN